MDILEGAHDEALPRATVVREVHRDAIEPRTEASLGLEPRDRAVRARERVDDDLLRRGGILRDRETETEDAVLVAIEEGVERLHVTVARRVHELAVAARVDVSGLLGRAPRHQSSLR